MVYQRAEGDEAIMKIAREKMEESIHGMQPGYRQGDVQQIIVIYLRLQKEAAIPSSLMQPPINRWNSFELFAASQIPDRTKH